jgi:hypothetical protein
MIKKLIGSSLALIVVSAVLITAQAREYTEEEQAYLDQSSFVGLELADITKNLNEDAQLSSLFPCLICFGSKGYVKRFENLLVEIDKLPAAEAFLPVIELLREGVTHYIAAFENPWDFVKLLREAREGDRCINKALLIEKKTMERIERE